MQALAAPALFTLNVAAALLRRVDITSHDGIAVHHTGGRLAVLTADEDGLNHVISLLAAIVDGDIAAPAATVKQAAAALAAADALWAESQADEDEAEPVADEPVPAAPVAVDTALTADAEAAADAAVARIADLQRAEGAVEDTFAAVLVAVAQAQALGVPNARLVQPNANSTTIARWGIAGRALLLGGEQPTDLKRAANVARFAYGLVIKAIKAKVSTDDLNAIDAPSTAGWCAAVEALLATPPADEDGAGEGEDEGGYDEELSDTHRALLATRGALLALVDALPVKGCWDADERALLAEIDGLLEQVAAAR